jgi:hypothetical protein
VKARKVLDALVDPYIALGMTCIVPLLDCINSLIKFAHAGESTLHPMYFPPKKKYKKILILYFFWKKNLGFDF